MLAEEIIQLADMFSMTAPLMVRLPSGEQRVIAEKFPHPQGVLFFDLYWHLADPEKSMHLISGQLKGDGPWKVGDHVFNVLGCHGTDAELAYEFQQWRDYLNSHSEEYPPQPLLEAIARKMGAEI